MRRAAIGFDQNVFDVIEELASDGPKFDLIPDEAGQPNR